MGHPADPPAPTAGSREASAAESTTGATVFRGLVWTFASKAVPLGFVAIVSIAAARFLGPEKFGRQSFIAFAEITIIYLLSGGLPLALSRFIGSALGRGRPDWI